MARERTPRDMLQIKFLCSVLPRSDKTYCAVTVLEHARCVASSIHVYQPYPRLPQITFNGIETDTCVFGLWHTPAPMPTTPRTDANAFAQKKGVSRKRFVRRGDESQSWTHRNGTSAKAIASIHISDPRKTHTPTTGLLRQTFPIWCSCTPDPRVWSDTSV